MIYIRMEQYDEAIGMFSRALLSDPYLAVAYFQRGYCQFLVEDYESAHADYSLAIEV